MMCHWIHPTAIAEWEEYLRLLFTVRVFQRQGADEREEKEEEEEEEVVEGGGGEEEQEVGGKV